MLLTLVRFAIRGARRHRRRTLLLGLLMAGGLFVLVLLKAVQDGYVAERLELGLRLMRGHAVVRSGDEPLRDAASLAATLTARPDVVAAAPRVRFTGLLRSVDASTGVVGLGVDPEAESAVTLLPQTLVAGSFLTPPAAGGLPPLVMGVALAERLDLDLGERAVFVGEAADGALMARTFAVSGLFRSGSGALDDSYVYVTRDVAATLSATAGDATEIVLRFADPERAVEHAAALSLATELTGHDVVPWTSLAPELSGAMEMLRVMERVRTVVLFGLVALALFSSVTLAVYERRREFGMLLAVGMAPTAVLVLVVLEVLLTALVALLVGAVSAVLVVRLLGQRGIDFGAMGAHLPGVLEGGGVVHPMLNAGNLAAAALWVLAVSLVVLIPPGLHVLRLDPAEALRER